MHRHFTVCSVRTFPGSKRQQLVTESPTSVGYLTQGTNLTKTPVGWKMKLMKAENIEIWEAPDFEEISAAMECTAYAATSID